MLLLAGIATVAIGDYNRHIADLLQRYLNYRL